MRIVQHPLLAFSEDFFFTAMANQAFAQGLKPSVAISEEPCDTPKSRPPGHCFWENWCQLTVGAWNFVGWREAWRNLRERFGGPEVSARFWSRSALCALCLNCQSAMLLLYDVQALAANVHFACCKAATAELEPPSAVELCARISTTTSTVELELGELRFYVLT